MEIIGNIKTYHWGKLGGSSAVSQLAACNDLTLVIDPVTPYAELWMGDHPSGCSTVKSTGEEIGKYMRSELPFLFKVLSIRQALSIQVHPDKQEAEFLHLNRPDKYKDPNHKPELAIAMTPFKALLGFRPYEEIINFINVLPPLKKLLDNAADLAGLRRGSKADMRKCFEKLMKSNEEHVAKCICDIFQKHSNVLQDYGILQTFKTIVRDFPGDVGVLAIFFLNVLQLKEGEAIFLAANEIHAYLEGDCIECMARSDNVIRAGLTPKYKDLEQLLYCLNYTGLPAERKIFTPKRLDQHAKLFSPPIEDFAVIQINLKIDDYKLHLEAHSAILLVIEGARMLHLSSCCPLSLKRGSIIYIYPDDAQSIEFKLGKACGGQPNHFIAYLATYNFYLNNKMKNP